jgi:hypothetical protein
VVYTQIYFQVLKEHLQCKVTQVWDIILIIIIIKEFIFKHDGKFTAQLMWS